MKTYRLALSPDYVPNWGLWEAVRELMQNAYDERDRTGCELSIEHSRGLLRITTVGRQLPRSSLLLGSTTKGDGASRGQHGEGYKLALLVLTRLGRAPTVYNGGVSWRARLAHCAEFDSDVLEIEERPIDPFEPGVSYVVEVTEPEWVELQQNLCPTEGLIEDRPGRIYVGGLLVETVPDFHYGYSLPVGAVQLDRDRGTVDGWDLSRWTSTFWANRADDDRMYALIRAKAPDVRYLEHIAKPAPAPRYSSWAAPIVQRYDREFAGAVPVSTQEEVQRATAAGVKWALVPETLKRIIATVRSILIPTTDGPAVRLTKFMERYRWRMDTEMKVELDDILRVMQEQHDAALGALKENDT